VCELFSTQFKVREIINYSYLLELNIVSITLYKIIEYNSDLKVILMTAYENLTCNKSRFTFLSESIPIARLLELINETLGGQSQPNSHQKQ